MTFINLEKTLTENLREYYLCKGIFYGISKMMDALQKRKQFHVKVYQSNQSCIQIPVKYLSCKLS